MGARLKLRRKPEVYRIPMPDKGLHEVAEVVFLRARSYGRPRVQDLFLASPLPSLSPYPVEIGFDYRDLVCNTRDFSKF